MEFFRELDSSVCLADPAALPLQDMTSLQLMYAMSEKGWRWSRLNRKCEVDDFKFGGPQKWYTSGVTVPDAYLRCLLDAERLCNEYAIESIPHRLPAEAYDHIFHGVPIQDAVRKVKQKKRKVPLPQLLDADVDALGDAHDAEAPGAVDDDAFPRAAAHSPDVRGACAEEDALSVATARSRSPSPRVELADVSAPESPAESDELLRELESIIDRVEDEAEPQPSVEEVHDGSDAYAAGSSSRSERPPREAQAGEPALDVALEVGRVASGGSFTFSRKQPKSAPPYGGYEAACKFHRKNLVTGCKRFIRIEENTDAGRQATLLALKHWCNCARNFNRQPLHVRMPVGRFDVPDSVVIDAQKISAPPPDHVKTDEELDEEAAKASEVSEKTSKPKSKQKRKSAASEGSKVAAKAKAKAKAKVEPKAGSKAKAGAAKSKAKAKAKVKASPKPAPVVHVAEQDSVACDDEAATDPSDSHSSSASSSSSSSGSSSSSS